MSWLSHKAREENERHATIIDIGRPSQVWPPTRKTVVTLTDLKRMEEYEKEAQKASHLGVEPAPQAPSPAAPTDAVRVLNEVLHQLRTRTDPGFAATFISELSQESQEWITANDKAVLDNVSEKLKQSGLTMEQFVSLLGVIERRSGK